jgi:ABC-type multidrug transport system fused ATPase/permease subunit
MKLARLLQFFAQFVAGFAIGFSRGWQLSLIMLSVVPFLGGAALLMVRSLVKAAAATQKSSAEAGMYVRLHMYIGCAVCSVSYIRTLCHGGSAS